MDNPQGLLYSTGNSAECYVAAWMGKEFGGEWIHVYVWLSPFAVYLKLSQHCYSAILQYKIKNLKEKKRYIDKKKKDWNRGRKKKVKQQKKGNPCARKPGYGCGLWQHRGWPYWAAIAVLPRGEMWGVSQPALPNRKHTRPPEKTPPAKFIELLTRCLIKHPVLQCKIDYIELARARLR